MLAGSSRARSVLTLAAVVFAVVVVVVAASGQPIARSGQDAAAAERGPLDPLTEAEILTAIKVIEASNKFPTGAFFPTVTLNEPPKSEVLAWSPGKSFRREAFANVYDRAKNKLFEVIVDLEAEKIVSFVEKPGLQPPVFESEYEDADAVVRADDRWVEAMEARGLDPDDVYLDVWAPGKAVLPDVPANTRLLRAISFYQGSLPNPYDRPIEGVVVVVDMNKLKVVDFRDTGRSIPVNKTISGNADKTRTGLERLTVNQPNGPSFEIRGNAVEWQRWHFRVGYNQRDGLVLHQIGYEDGNDVRPVIHRLSLDEIYVPYGLPDRNWDWRAALDIAEYNLGQYIEPLKARVDVPTNTVFFDVATPSDVGTRAGEPVFPLPKSIAMYERDAGVLWDRTDPTTFEKDARFARELVVTASYVNGNYTYTTEYIFRMDGGIDVREGATGTTLNRGVKSVAEGNQFGTTVAPNIAAPSHQHFFNFRIDFDVDGPTNRIVEENTASVASSFGNAFETTETTLGTEQFRDTNPESDRRWSIASTSKRNALGEPTAYELKPIDLIHPYSERDYEPLVHAPFAQHNLWVTQYKDSEEHSVGDYPNQGQEGEGLPKYIADKANINGRDLVVWYTAGLTHIPTVEEFPVMTRETVGFAIRPNGFFDENPALDAP